MKKDGIATHIDTMFVVRAGQEGGFGRLSDITIPKINRASQFILESASPEILRSPRTLLMSGVDPISVATADLINTSLNIRNRNTSSVLNSRHDEILSNHGHRDILRSSLNDYLHLIIIATGELAPFFFSMIYHNDLGTTGSIDPVHGTVHQYRSGKHVATFTTTYNP